MSTMPKLNERIEVFGLKGKRKKWKGRRIPPGMFKDHLGRVDWSRNHTWADHYYRFLSDDGHEFYVSEPYPIASEDITQLAELVKSGWSVYIGSDSGYGHGTIRIVIESADQMRRRYREMGWSE